MISPEYVDGLEKRIDELTKERNELQKIIQDLQNCRRTCPTILRFAVSAKEILKDASKWDRH